MRTSRIFQNISFEPLQHYDLDEKATRHLIAVLRFKLGDTFTVFNGDGFEYVALIREIKRHTLRVAILQKREKNLESPLALHLGQAIAKGDKMDYILQKATELGVTAITPIFSERTEVQLSLEREEKKVHHWREVIIAACEQCGRNKLPILQAPQKFSDWVKTVSADNKFILDPSSEETLKNKTLSERIAVLIGPEGGWTSEEKEEAIGAGFLHLRLGPRILRTETAGLAFISVFQYLAGDLQ